MTEFANISRPLAGLLKKNVAFSWGSDQVATFTNLISALTNAPFVTDFDPYATTEVSTGVSGYAVGAVLAQRQGGLDRLITYASRLLSTPESSYSITERECLALVWSVTKFCAYLHGHSFTAATDHHALWWLFSIKDPVGWLGRWALRLKEYTFDVKYKSGRLHQDADCVFHHPVDPPDDNEEDGTAFLSTTSGLCINEARCHDPPL